MGLSGVGGSLVELAAGFDAGSWDVSFRLHVCEFGHVCIINVRDFAVLVGDGFVQFDAHTICGISRSRPEGVSFFRVIDPS